MTPTGKLESITNATVIRAIVGAATAAAIAISLFQFAQHSGYIANDATQYLAGARYLLTEQSYATDILYFDEHYATGSLPAPQTVWPPGVSATVAAISSLGLSLEQAGRTISMLSFVLLVACFVVAVWILTESVAATVAAAIWQLVVVEFWRYAAGIGSDLIFTTIASASVLLYLYAVRSRTAATGRAGLSFPMLGAISLLVGIGFFFRYAGVLLIAWAMVLIAAELVARALRRTESLKSLVLKSACAALPAIAIFVALTARNFAITGGIRGGNNKVVVTPLTDLLTATAKVFVTVPTGVNQSDFFGSSVVLAAIGGLAVLSLGAVLVGALLGLWRVVSSSELRSWRGHAFVSLSALLAIYVVGMIVMSSRMAITYGDRYLLPIIPLSLMLAVALWPYARSILLAGVAVIAAAQAVAFGNIPEYPAGVQPPAYAGLRDWAADKPGALIAVGDGQRIGHFSGRPTLAVSSMRFTAADWSEAELRDLARRHNVRFVVVSRADDPALYAPFPASLMRGEGAPWLQLEATLDNAVVYSIQP